MEKHIRKNESKGIQAFIDKQKIKQITETFVDINKVSKSFKNKRKKNELFSNPIFPIYKNKKEIINTKKFKEKEKNSLYNSLNNNLENITNMKSKKFFNTELDSKNNLYSLRNIYSINLGENKNKINIKKIFRSPQNRNKEDIFNTVMGMCHSIYDSKKTDNNSRMKLREEIIHNINNYINMNLKKNVLCPEIFIRKKKSYEIISPNKIKRKLKSIDSNRMNLKTIVNKFCQEPDEKYSDLKKSRIITYENYAIKDTIFKHPQIYTLNNNFYKVKKPISIKTQKNLKSFLEFSNLIPERKKDQKEINKQIYSVYKTMKGKNEIAFHI